MKLTKQLQVYIKTGIFLTVIGLAKSATERMINQTTEIVTVRYETPKSNMSAVNVSVMHETKLTDSPINLTDYEDSLDEVSGEIVEKKDSDGSTTQNYENSKMLFSYVVPVTSEEAPQVEKKEEEIEEDDGEDIVVDEEEEEEEERGNLDEEEENSENSEADDEEEYTEEDSGLYQQRQEEREEEEEEEERRPYNRRKDIIGQGNYFDDSDEEHYKTEDDHGRADDEVNTEKGSTHVPINPWRHSYPHLIREKKPFFEFTTIQPYSDPRPVSYSSVVYDPDGKSKTELSGSFYKKPLRVTPESGVFPVTEEHVSEDTKNVPVTTQSIIERSIKSPDEDVKIDEEEGEENEDYLEEESVTPEPKQNVTIILRKSPKIVQSTEEEEENYKEPEAVTSNLKIKMQDATTIKPKRTSKQVQPIPTLSYDWEEDYIDPETVTSKVKYETQDITTVAPKKTPKQNFNWEKENEEEKDYVEPETATSRIIHDITTFTPKRIKNFVHHIPRHNFDWEEDEPITERYEEREYFEEAPREDLEEQLNPKRYNEKTSQKFRDKNNRENYYEQTINTRFSSKEKGTSEEDKKYESEVGDLMKPKVEELRHETVQKNFLFEDDEIEPEDMTENVIPAKKDRNQLYEYLIADGQFKQGISENKESLLRHILTTPKEEVVETEPPPKTTEPPKPKTTVIAKPQQYSFGTITNPKSSQFMTFKNGETDDITYNRIVSNIQSLFTPTTKRPTSNYEQHFLPTHGNCQHQHPEHDSINYESFIKPSQTHPSPFQEDEEEEEEEEEEDNPMPKRLPMKTYIIHKKPQPIPTKEIHYRPVKKSSAIKVTVHPMPYREAKPVMYRSAVYLGPTTNSNKLVRKIIYYTPKEKSKKYNYSPTNQILRIIRPQPTLNRMFIIRKIEQTPS